MAQNGRIVIKHSEIEDINKVLLKENDELKKEVETMRRIIVNEATMNEFYRQQLKRAKEAGF